MKLLGRLGPFAIGALVAYLLLPGAPDPVVYREVIVRTEQIEAREPPARPPTIVERVRFVNIQPTQLATAPGGGAGDVAAFCRPTVLSLTDTVQVTDTLFLVRSGVHSPAPIWNPFAKDQLLLTGPTSVGDLRAFDYSVRNGFDFRTEGAGARVRYPRGAFVRDLVEAGSFLYTAYSLGGALVRSLR